jgi:hypothetical protein
MVLTAAADFRWAGAADAPAPNAPAAGAPSGAPAPSVTIIKPEAARGMLGRAVKSAAGENMGRIVDVLIDPAGQTRAAIIDFGGFLGVGSRKIAVDWNALRFGRAVEHGDDVGLELTKDQLKAAPEYKEGSPVVVVGASGGLEPLNFPKQAPEK